MEALNRFRNLEIGDSPTNLPVPAPNPDDWDGEDGDSDGKRDGKAERRRAKGKMSLAKLMAKLAEEEDDEDKEPLACEIDWTKPVLSENGNPVRKFTPARVDRIIRAASRHCNRQMIAQCGGVSEMHLRRWLDRGQADLEAAANAEDETGEEQDTSIWADFYLAFSEAEGVSGETLLARIDKASKRPEFWAAAMTILERKYPDQWGRRQPKDNNHGVITHKFEIVEREDWRSVASNPYGEGERITDDYSELLRLRAVTAAAPLALPPPPDDNTIDAEFEPQD